MKKRLFSSTKSLSGCLDDLKASWRRESNLRALLQDWSSIAGEKLYPNCTPLSFKRGILVIGASHPQWRQALLYTRNQLLATIKAAGHEIKDIRIQQHYPSERKELETEESIWGKHPSRSDIHGLTTCKTCKSPAPSGEIKLWNKCIFCRRKDLSNL